MRITDEQKERANLVNLPQFLMAHGFDLKKVGREYVWKEHDSLHIKDNEPGERGGWYRFSEHKGGDNIGFLREYMGMSFVEAVEALNGEHYDRTYTPSRTYEPKPVQKTARELSLAEADNARRVFAYLCKTRGLDYDLVSALVRSGVIAQEEKTGNVLFKYYDDQGKVIGAEKVGTSTEHKFKGIATGSAGGHGFEVVRGSGEKAYFFESAIDMLSYLQIHDQELDNCRLVSMMGVKPNIVLDTMLRHNIPPENVVLCSDNDTAGNEFAQRLQEQYPQMKRAATPDTYKDWNDMLRGIPKETEQKKEADKTDMQLYGNKMWNDATDNRDKSLVTVSVFDFPKVQEQLERAGMNYYGYVNGNSVVMAINDKDVELFGRIVGAPNITPRKSNRPYSPPEKNIIGNAEYRYIPQKQYVSADRDLILKMAELMQNEGISFSGRIYPTGKGTLTVSNDELWKVRDIQKRIVGMRKQFAVADKAQEVGNRGYRQNRDTHHYMSKLTPEQFKEIKPFLETSVSYHAIARDGKVAFAVDKDNAPAFHRALENAVREVNMLHNMTDLGLPMEQMIALSPVIHRLAVEDVKLNLADFFDRRYDEAQFGEMLSLVNAYLAQAPAERYGENSKLSEMLEAKSSFDRSIELADFFSQHDFSDEQRAAITAMFVGDVTRGQLDSIDETFTVEDIQAYDEIMHNTLQESDVADFLTVHKQTVIDRENEANEPEFTEKEQAFLNGNIESFLAKAALSVEEMADIGCRLYEAGYIDSTAPSESSIFGNGLSDADLHDMARRMQNSEDICKELACAVLGEQSSFITRQGNEFSVEYRENSLVAKYGNAEREISYESIGDEMLCLIENEYRQAFIDRENAAKKQAEEKLFEQADLAMFIAEHTLSSDEWESMAYPLFEKGYLDKHKPDDKGIFGYHLSEPAFYDLAYRHHSGEDIRKELALGLMEHSKTDDIDFVFEDGNISTRTYLYNSDLVHTLHAEFGEDNVKLSFGNAEREITYAEIGQAFLDRTFEEFNDLAFWWVRDDMREAIPDISDEAIKQLISAFDSASRPDWESNLQKRRQIKRALYDLLGNDNQTEKAFSCIAKQKYNVEFNDPETRGTIHFGLLGNGITAYDVSRTDPKTHDYPTVAHISPEGVVKIYDDSLSAEDMELINEQARSAREKFMSEWNMLSPVQQFQKLLDRADISTSVNINREKLSMEQIVEKYMPFVFFGEGERPEPETAEQIKNIEFIGDKDSFDTVKSAAQNDSFGTTVADGDRLSIVINADADINDVRRLIETAQDNGVYLSAPSAKMLEARFGADFMQTEHKPTVADLAVGDIIMYEGSRREVESISEKSISLKNLDAPDFGGILLSTNDVYAYDGWQQDMESKGFEILSKAEKSEPTIKAPEVKKVHQVITNAGFDGGIDDKMEYATVDEAVKAGRDYLVDGYLGFSVYNQETKQIEHTEGDFPITHAFNADILKLNSINEPEYKGYVTMAKIGDFYEMYGKDAEIGAEVLGLRMLSKHGEPMVGFPEHIKSEYSKKLGEAGYTVLIEQAFELNPPKRESLTTLEDVISKFFEYDYFDDAKNLIESEGGIWKLSLETALNGYIDPVIYHNGNAECSIHLGGDTFYVEPYSELSAIPAIVARALKECRPDMNVELESFEQTFKTPLDKAKYYINSFCEGEYGNQADFTDLHNVDIAYTTLTDDELPIQVTVDLIEWKISYEFDGEVFSVEQYDNIEEMIDNALSCLDFSDLVSIPDEVIERHTGKDEHTVSLMSDASEVEDISSPADDVQAVMLAYKGDAESLAEIKEMALSLGAVVTEHYAEGTISISTYENHKDELDGLAYELGLTAVNQAEDIDKPLFSDASVIEEIQRNEHSDRPFWELPDTEGEQLSLFGDPEPLTASKPEKPNSEFVKGPVVDGVQVYEALAAEIDRGTGFVNGKLRVQVFYEEQHPTLQQLADFLKKEYGTGGHSGNGNISFVDYDSKGLTFSFENGEKFRHSWYNVAVMTEARLKDNTYLSAEQQAERQAQKEDKSVQSDSEQEHSENKSCFVHSASQDLDIKFTLKDSHSITIQQGDREKTVPVEDSDEFTFKVLKTKIKAKGGAEGLFDFLEKIANDPDGFMSAYARQIASAYLGEPKEQKQEISVEAAMTDNSTLNPLDSKSAIEADLPTVKNLNQLKKAAKVGMKFEITAHTRPECVGERRQVSKVDSTGFYSHKVDENGEQAGKDLFMSWDRAKNWSFDGSEMTSHLEDGSVLMSFHFVDSSERTKEPEREPFSEEIAGADDTIIYRITENADDQYKYNVQIFTQGENGEFAYSGNGKFCETLDDAHAFVEQDIADRKENADIEQSAPDKRENFTITDDALGEGGAKAKFRANIEAIRTLKTLEAEKRPATAEEKETLSKYVGWGALSKAFDKSDDKWSAEYQELAELLTPEEYRQARASVNDAFYTSPTIIDSIYEALGNFGFHGGSVLEPAMGIGNFFGRMPEEMQASSQLYGVEIDSLSGRIAQALYPDADIAIQGFEKNRFQNGCFDVAVGNVPFGDLSFKDMSHGATKLHDYFFLEALDKLKNGGIMAFVTSAGTLDKRDEATRQMLADKADFIGAIRLPGGKNGAFRDNAGTEVTTDIIFLQKREGKSIAEMSDIPDWVHIGETADGLPINQYFADHPDMVLGTVVEGNKLYGSGTMVVAEDGFDLKAALHEAVSKLSADISPERGRDVYAKTADGVQVQIPSNLRNYSFFMSDDQVFFKKNNAACEFRFDKGTAQHKRFKAFIELRDLTRELLEAQELDKPDSVIKDLQAKLNAAYDDFYEKYGLIHSQTNKRYFSEDVSYNLVAGLEKSYDKNKLKEKSDIFFKRTIVPPKAVDHVETALEALTLSIAEKAKIDFEYMSSLTGMTEDELKHDLTGEIFRVPHTENDYQTASEYLSGDIRAKLREAEEIAEYDADFNINVSALKAAMPEPLKAGDIDVKIGATWLDPKYYEQFIYELLQTPEYQRSDSPAARWNQSSIIGVEYSEHTNSFHVSNKSSDKSVLATQKYGSHKMNAYDIFEHILNLQDPKVYMTVEVPDGYGDTKEKRVVDIDATRVVQRKADDMRKAFKNWIFKDPERREAIVQRYNELFNSIRPREYDGSALSFPMMTSDIQLHDHQKNAIAHAMFGGNTLFAHSVGAGKTYEMIATAMESKRLGLCTKSLFAVPNHLTEQIGDDFQKLYPSANILVATKKDFKKENRQQLFAKIATGNYDAVIIGHSQLGMIPVSRERQVMTIQSQIDDILQGIEELKRNEGSKFQIKAMERTRKSLQKQLDRLEKTNQDDTLTFEQLGVDKLFIDEAHEFKNLFVSTKLNNVAGISSSASQKALDLFLKCRYLDEKTGGRGIVFATGTPLSNSITELHTMMRYLEYDFLRDHGLQHFDGWVSVFGEQKTDWELKPAGNGFKERTRIAQYSGLPELMSMFKQIADIRTADTLKLDVPDCDYQVVQVEATPFQQELVQELADRADAINSGNVDPTVDNMLKITSDGRKLGLDPRLIDPSFEDNPETKLNKCVENVARIHAETAEDRLTQIIFCDLGVPHKSSADAEVDGDDAEQSEDNKSAAERESLEEECDFCVYDDIRDKLIAKGIPAEEIAYIHDAKTEKQKADLFDKVRSGEIRVLLGSTAKMGTGTNVQKKLIAVHDLDIPWRPADLEQRAGRIIRQGNENKNVQIFRYVTKGTFDAYSYQTLENKQRFISQIMTSKTPARKCEDVDQQALTYSEIKALCTGDERVKEKLMLENDVKELRALAAEHRNTVYEMEDKIKRFPEQEQRLMSILDDLHTDREALRKLKFDPETKLPVFKITIDGKEYTDKKEAAKAFETAALAIKYTDTPVKIGSFQGFDLTVTMNSNLMGGGMTACLKGAASHTTKLISSFAHNLNRLESALYNIDGRINGVKENLAKLRLDYAEAQKIVAEPFPQQAELESKEERLKTVTDELNLAAIEAKKNAPKREKTCYFERAKMKKEAMRVSRQKPNPSKNKSKDKKKPNLE